MGLVGWSGSQHVVSSDRRGGSFEKERRESWQVNRLWKCLFIGRRVKVIEAHGQGGVGESRSIVAGHGLAAERQVRALQACFTKPSAASEGAAPFNAYVREVQRYETSQVVAGRAGIACRGRLPCREVLWLTLRVLPS